MASMVKVLRRRRVSSGVIEDWNGGGIAAGHTIRWFGKTQRPF
jgi:hypothetical protein